MLPRSSWALTPPESFTPGPDVILGDLPSLIEAGSNGTQVGLMMATDICNNGDVPVDWFRLPETDHPVIPQNLYRMSGGANNTERFEQIGQSWAMHQFFPLQQNACGFGCTPSPDSAHLGVGCSTSDTASFNASQSDLGSRAWVNPFTGIFPSTSNSHTGHTHDGTTHRILVEANDLNTAMNPGATYYGEAQLVTPHEYAWCAAHTGECNMSNNVSYRQFAVAGTTSFTFSAVGDTVRTIPAIFAWPGATIQVIEPEQGVDGKAFLAYKVTQFGPWDWHYEYAIYNQNLDRGINYFSVPAGCGIGSAGNAAFHAPLNHPGIADDGTVGNAGYSNTPWNISIVDRTAYWYTETFAQNPNANALRWGTLYNFRFDGGPPTNGTGAIGFFKTGKAITVQVPGPAPECTPTIPPPTPTATVPPATPTPTGTPTPPPTPTATPSSTPSPTPSATPTVSPTPSPPTKAINLSTRMRVQTGDSVGIGGFIVTGNTTMKVAIRGIGPSLTQFGIPGVMANPTLELHDSSGALLVQNDNWQDDSSQASQLSALGLAPSDPNESGIVTTLPPSVAYTVILAGKNGGTGVGIVEVYDVNAATGSQLANISTRGLVQVGSNVMIGGFILSGGSQSRVAVRGLGPSLGLNPPVADPTLELHDGNGATLVANDNWQDDQASAAQLTSYGLALPNPNESGIFASLPSGQYTVILAGKNGGTGIGLVEVYNIN